MKVYIYYLIDKKIIKHLHLLGVLENISHHFVENEPFLYAYTNDKKIAKKFEETRNSSVFFRKVVDMNEDEFSKFEFSYRSEIKIDENELKVGKDNYVIFPTTISEYSYSVYYGRETINDILEKIPSSDGFLFFSDVENSALILSCVLGFCYGKNMPVLVLDEEKKFIKLFPCENKKLSLKNFYSENELFNWLEKNIENLKSESLKRANKNSLLEQGISCSADSFEFYLEKEKTGICKSILNSGIDVNSKTLQGVPLLCVATRNDSKEMLELLLEKGADINEVSEDRGYSPVMDAVWRKNYEIAKLLIDHGADLSTMSSDGQSILVLAVGNGNSKIVKLLLNSGADPDVKDSMGMSARDYASLFKNEELMKLMGKK